METNPAETASNPDTRGATGDWRGQAATKTKGRGRLSQPVLEYDFLLHLRVRGRPKYSLIDHAYIPPRQIFGRHGQFTRGKQPAFPLFRSQSRWTESVS